MNRRSPRHRGVYQRCEADCPPDRCRVHKWAYAVELPAGPDGKRRQLGKGGYETAREASDARADVVRRHRTGTLPTDAKRTLGEWLPEWLAGKVSRGELESTTARTYSDHVRTYLLPKLGHRKLSELRGIDITRAYEQIQHERRVAIDTAQALNRQYAEEAERLNARRAAAGKQPIPAKRVAVPRTVSPATVARIHAVLSGALKSATKAGLVARNVAGDAELPKVERRKVKPASPEQYGAFLDEVESNRLYPLIVVAGYSGLRRGELAGLKWADVNMTTGRLVVARQRVSVAYAVEERDVKTEAGQDRVVYLGPVALAVLKAWRKQQAAEQLAWGSAYHDGGYIFTLENGQPYHPESLTKSFKRLADHAGMPVSKLHGLRHFRAAALISTGADISAVSKAMGHSSIQVTNDIYGSLFDKAHQEMSEKADALIPRRRTA